MKILTDPDETQSCLIPYLRQTEELLSKTATFVSGRDCDAEIFVMPDLGLPHNVQRIHGGFLTGAYYSWESSIPLVPVDSTVNVCGVSVFQLEQPISTEEEFNDRVWRAKETMAQQTPYLWNYNTGNHFITVTEVREPGHLPVGQYLVLHASAAEFKNQFNGLYPSPGNWFSQHVKVLNGDDGRYLRYLSGKRAEDFYRTAEMLEGYQRERQRICAELIAGPTGIAAQVISVPHYGMPDESSVAIGCQWLPETDPAYLMLTRPGSPLYMVAATPDGENRVETSKGTRILTPHGLGVRAKSPFTFKVEDGSLEILGRNFSTQSSLAGEDFIAIRDFDGDRTIKAQLQHCPGDVTSTLYPLYSHYRQGKQS